MAKGFKDSIVARSRHPLLPVGPPQDMTTPAAIGIIGAGRIGQAMARTARRAGRPVVIANSRGPQSLAGVVSVIDATKAEVIAPHAGAGFFTIDLGGLSTGGALQQLGGPPAGRN